MTLGRTILHLDMDAFFAAVEQLDRPELRGKPVLVGHDGPRGVVATASYEARPFGCHSAQPMVVARRLCPQAIVVQARHERYHEVSTRMFSILDEFSPLVEPLSVDEAFLDLTGTERTLGDADSVARRLKDRIHADLKLTASVGLAPNKFLAKLASDLEKPDGLTIIRTEDVDHVLPPLPVTRIWGIGKVTAEHLAKFGIRTIGDLRAMSPAWLQEKLGNDAEHYLRLARGQDDRPVTPDREAKSIGHEQTFEEDLQDPDEVRTVLLDQVEQVGQRLRRHGMKARGVSIKIRFGNFQTVSRSMTLDEPTDSTTAIWDASRGLFDRWAMEYRPVRLIGMTAERLSMGEGQMGLFVDPQVQKQTKLDRLADQINSKFGKRTIRRGGAG